MADPQGSGSNQPGGKGFNRTYLLLLVGALIAILAMYYIFAFTRQGAKRPGPTPTGSSGSMLQLARPSTTA